MDQTQDLVELCLKTHKEIMALTVKQDKVMVIDRQVINHLKLETEVEDIKILVMRLVEELEQKILFMEQYMKVIRN